MLSSSNPNIDVTINYLGLGVLLMKLLLFAPQMAPLANIHLYVDNMATHGWSNRGSVIAPSSVSPILKEIYLAAGRQHIHASAKRTRIEENKMADAVSQLTQLPDRKFLSHFHTHLPQSKHWRLLPISSL